MVFYVARSAGRNLFIPNTIVTVFVVVYVVKGRVKAVWESTFTEQPLGKMYNSNHNPAGIKASW